MNFNKKILLLIILISFISICGVYSLQYHQNTDNTPVNYSNLNETNGFGCCSIVWQLENNDTIMSYRRDSNVSADVFINETDWHGKQVIKQYKTDHGYFNHVIITNDGWVIGLGGIDDGHDSEICENITSQMISDDYNISESSLKKIQNIKKPYGRGHVVIKAPNGNYGFATPNKLKTGKLEPGQYISIPNDYLLSRGGNLSLKIDDKIKAMTELSQSDLYGIDRREIVTYDIHIGNNTNTTDIYIANEDGSHVGANYTKCIDNICFNNTIIKGKDIPIAPNYKKIGTISFDGTKSEADNFTVLLFMGGFVVFVIFLFIIVFRLVRFIKFHIRR